ncbi:MAG TPA: metallopeptidase TldD-related protein [Amycolatopsis sp.]|nr:metallopeptidase TldD-related protein [Amycolatopsis sp.]
MIGVRRAAERAVEARRDADACVAIAEETTTAHLRWAGNAPTTSGFARDERLTVIAIAGDSVGVLTRHGELTGESVSGLVRAAERVARFAAPAPDAQPLITGDCAQWQAEPVRTSFGAFRGFVPRLNDTFDREARLATVLYGYAEHQLRTTYLAASNGLHRRHVQPTGVLELTVRAGDGPATAWAGSAVSDFSAVDPGATVEKMRDRLCWADRRVALPAGRYQVILSPSAVADLMLHLYRAADARAAAGGHSVFSKGTGGTRVGDRLSDAPLTLYSDPAEPGLACAPFTIARESGASSSVFDNGRPLSKTDWISGGVLSALVQTRHTAGLTGLAHTPGIDNLVLRGGSGSLAEMIASTRRGLLVMALWYLREVDPATLLVTGLTRDGVFLIEDGEVVGAVPDLRFTESPVSLLSRVSEIGGTEPAIPREWGDYFTRMAMPPLRVEEFALSPAGGAS